MKERYLLVLFLLLSTVCYAETAGKEVSYKVVKHEPQNGEEYRQRGLAYEKVHNYSQALADYNKGIEIDSNVALLYWNRGLLSYKNGDYEQAITDFSKYLEFKPESELTLLMRGQAYYKKDSYDLAISDFNNYISIDTWSPYFGYINLAFTYLKSKDLDKAWDYANKAQAEQLKSKPNTADPLIGLGLPSEAIEELKKMRGE